MTLVIEVQGPSPTDRTRTLSQGLEEVALISNAFASAETRQVPSHVKFDNNAIPLDFRHDRNDHSIIFKLEIWLERETRLTQRP